MLGRLIGLWQPCRHLCTCCSPVLPKCSISQNGCYVLTANLLVGLTDSHLYMYKCEQWFNYFSSADTVNKYSQLVICCDSKPICVGKKCVRCDGDNKCLVQRKCMQNVIENWQIFGIKATKVIYFFNKRNSGKTVWGPNLYVFFWVIPRRLNFICRRFGTLCLFHLHSIFMSTCLWRWNRVIRNVGI